MSKKKTIDEKGLDELLRGLYLEENSKSLNEKEANFILEQDYSAKFDPKKEKELLDRLQNKKGFGNLGLFLSLFIFLGVSIFLWVYFSKTDTVSNNSDQISLNNKISKAKTTDGSDLKESNKPELNQGENVPLKIVDTFVIPRIVSFVVDSLIPNSSSISLKVERKFETNIPYLKEEDKIKYLKIKDQMLSKLYKSDKGLYTHLEANKISYANKGITVDAFTIRNMGISNLEYKTFLADLLIQKRNEDYLLAQVVPENWAKNNYNNLANTYFEDEKYNDFPIVNITYEGANLFCKWLENEIKIYMQKNNLKVKPLHIRLPYDEEWIYAAEDGYAKIAFENGYNTIYDATEGLVDKTFSRRAEIIKKRVKRIDTLYTLYTTNRYGWNEKEIIGFFDLGFRSYKTSITDTIYVDRMKVFGKIGRVSEIVCQRNSSALWFCGLSWKNKTEYLKLENEFKTNLSSPFVGFRPVIINSNDPVYKRPFY